MSDLWLDAVLAVPAVGIQIVLPPSVALRLRDVVAPALDRFGDVTTDLREPARKYFQVETAPNALGGSEMRISGKDGFTHRFVHQEGTCHVVVEYSFAPIETKTVGKLPSMRYEARVFSALVKQCQKRVEALIAPLRQASKTSAVIRYGLMASAELAAGQLPPGFVHYREWLERPWRKKKSKTVGKLQTNILAKLDEDEDSIDQCHHGFGFELMPDVEKTEFRVMLDYQRVFAADDPTRTPNLGPFIDRATKYFQDFAFPEERSWD